MRRIGITGGIGAGKSLVCKIFEILGIPNYSADTRAKWLQVHNKEVKSQIEKLFGNYAYLKNGQLNRAHIAQIVFNDKSKLEALNKIVHPAVAEDFETWCQQNSQKPFILKEAALLFETGSYKQLDANILVYAPEELRIERTQNRDPQRSTSEIKQIITKQMDQDQSRKLADYVIINDGKTSLIKQCNQLFDKLS